MPHNLRLIEVDCPEFGPVSFLGRRLHVGHDYLIRANCARDALDVLVFLDSRGIGAAFDGSLAQRILTRLEDSRRYLAICRPLELTTWATLFNFVSANALRPKQIITNMGFVDFTPKKQEVLVDALRQVEARMGAGLAQAQPVERYMAAGGEPVALFSMSYDARYREQIQTMIAGTATIVINTPSISAEIRIPRHRPKSFFSAVELGNSFNRAISGATVIDLPPFDESQTYDAVHYTGLGHEPVFKRVAAYL